MSVSQSGLEGLEISSWQFNALRESYGSWSAFLLRTDKIELAEKPDMPDQLLKWSGQGGICIGQLIAKFFCSSPYQTYLMTTLTKSWLQVGSFVYMEALAPPGTDKFPALNK